MAFFPLEMDFSSSILPGNTQPKARDSFVIELLLLFSFVLPTQYINGTLTLLSKENKVRNLLIAQDNLEMS